MKTKVKDWLKVMVLLLDEAAAVVVVILILRLLKVEIPLPITIVVALLLGALIFIVHKAVIPTFHKKQVTGSEGMIGLTGIVTQPLTPVGTVKVSGEYWKARAAGENIAAGEEVTILGVDGLKLRVGLKENG